jgi:GNAT superfamily N-acetyltransferase
MPAPNSYEIVAANNLPAVSIALESKRIQALTHLERKQLRGLTDGTSDSHMLAVLRENPKHAWCFLALHGEDIVAWSFARWFKPLSERPRNAHLSVFVSPQWRRRGLGRYLVENTVGFVKQNGLVPWVFAGRSDQLEFYRECPAVTHISRSPFALR